MKQAQPGDIYEAFEEKKAPDTSDVTLTGPAINQGDVVQIYFMCGIDETTAGKTIELGFDQKGTKKLLKEEPAGTNKKGVILNRALILVGGEAPYCVINSPTANDELRLFARGIYL